MLEAKSSNKDGSSSWQHVNRSAIIIQRWWRRKQQKKGDYLKLEIRVVRQAVDLLIDDFLRSEMIPVLIQEVILGPYAPLAPNSPRARAVYHIYECLLFENLPGFCKEIATEVVDSMVSHYLRISKHRQGSERKLGLLEKIIEGLIHQHILPSIEDIVEEAIQDEVKAYFVERDAREIFENAVENEIRKAAAAEIRKVRMENLRSVKESKPKELKSVVTENLDSSSPQEGGMMNIKFQRLPSVFAPGDTPSTSSESNLSKSELRKMRMENLRKVRKFRSEEGKKSAVVIADGMNASNPEEGGMMNVKFQRLPSIRTSGDIS
mmetsp:Transcript_16327/g.26123  ORF Transcript_16327/g.26123 Transcript_16327/m.26123 type:complete len:321 (-) Transcript_16327:163-1125(-)